MNDDAAPTGDPAGDPQQTSMFGDEVSSWYELWQGMPEFVQEDQTSVKSIIVHFATMADYRQFADLIGQRLLPNTRSIWHPEAEIGSRLDKRYVDQDQLDDQGQLIEPTG
jgi:hypothetical protein